MAEQERCKPDSLASSAVGLIWVYIEILTVYRHADKLQMIYSHVTAGKVFHL